MGRRSRTAWDPRRLAPAALAAALAAAYLVWQLPSLDLAAAEYRAWLFGHAGFALWDAQWYGGHHVPGYSVVFPPLAHWLGPRLLGALAVLVAALLFERLAHARWGERAWLGATWFAAGAAAQLFSGRVTFVLGLPLALAALLALQRRRPALAIAFAIATSLASPVDALFLALAGIAYALAARRAIGVALAAAALAPVLALALLFPEGGVEPFGFTSLWPVLAFATVALLVVLPREERALRIGVALYALGCLAAFALETPAGSNAVRLGALAAGPLAALVLWRRRPLALLLLAPFLLWWQWNAAVSDVRTTSGDPSVHAAYYAPLLAELGRLGATGGPGAGRLEIPFTRVHWEARWVAPSIPLARGWERQLDVARNAVFYANAGRDGAPLTAARYATWLHENAVRWVALPDVRLDYSAQGRGAPDRGAGSRTSRGLARRALAPVRGRRPGAARLAARAHARGRHRLARALRPAPGDDPPARPLDALLGRRRRERLHRARRRLDATARAAPGAVRVADPLLARADRRAHRTLRRSECRERAGNTDRMRGFPMIAGLRNIERRVLPPRMGGRGPPAAPLRRRLLRVPARARRRGGPGRDVPRGTPRRSSTSSTACTCSRSRACRRGRRARRGSSTSPTGCTSTRTSS